ncbi:MAG TPA: sigma-70 family RNA polymerase sigma factor [Polyangiaceae bacterium]|nr:sigma-70 family RNA polymerase sigma factor [Polyangiaceae bacterium]
MSVRGSQSSRAETFAESVQATLPSPEFREVYDTHFAFVWRAVANRGVPAAALDDVVQEVFLVVHRKLSEFEGRSSLRTWLAAIVRRVVADHMKKRGNRALGQELSTELPAESGNEPAAQAERRAALLLAEELLATMSEVQREVFVLYELEQMTTREIAELTSTNENTVQTRLKAARRMFQEGVARHQARDTRNGGGT